MSHKEFRKVQAYLDKKGITTCIKRVGKKQFQFINNFEIVRTYKTRISCKRQIIKLYNCFEILKLED